MTRNLWKLFWNSKISFGFSTVISPSSYFFCVYPAWIDGKLSLWYYILPQNGEKQLLTILGEYTLVIYMQGRLQLTGAAVSTGVAPPTPADLLSIWPTGVVPIAIVHGHTVCRTIAAIVIPITLHSETQTHPDSAIVGVTINCVLLGPGWVNRQVILDVNVIHFVIRGWAVYIPNLNIELKTSLWNIEWVATT